MNRTEKIVQGAFIIAAGMNAFGDYGHSWSSNNIPIIAVDQAIAILDEIKKREEKEDL
jgi:hypothetical protein